MIAHLPYPPHPSSDDLAEDYLNHVLRDSTSKAWPLLLSEEYAMQTHRVLKTFQDSIDNAFVNRNATLAAVRAKFSAGEISKYELGVHRAEYEDWKRRAFHFRSLVAQRYRQAADIADAQRGFALANSIRAVLITLAEAVVEHRERVDEEYEPTVEDRLLWARLTTLRVPEKDRPAPLEEYVQRGRVNRRDPAPAAVQ